MGGGGWGWGGGMRCRLTHCVVSDESQQAYWEGWVGFGGGEERNLLIFLPIVCVYTFFCFFLYGAL